MRRKEIQIINKLGLHARAAAKLVQTATTFSSDISVRHNDRKVSGKSIMGIMMLAAAKGSTIEVSVSGEDEDKALDAIEALVDDKFGEKE